MRFKWILYKSIDMMVVENHGRLQGGRFAAGHGVYQHPLEWRQYA